jgi:hypothetical protein
MRWGLVVAFWLLASASFGQDASLVYTDTQANTRKTRVLAQADKKVRSFFEDRFRQRIDTPILLLGTSEPDNLNVYLREALSDQGRRQRSSPIDTKSLCENKSVGAAANRPYILLCWKKPQVYDALWERGLGKRLSPILAHEFTHQLQYHLAGDDPVQRIKGSDELLLGPSWMIEGVAEVFEHIYAVEIQGEHARDDDEQTFFNMQSPARRSQMTLSDLTPTGSTKGRAAYGTARFAAYLLSQRSGTEALLEYFEVLGVSKDRDIAFQQVFGLSFDAFEDNFERVRRDFAAAKVFAAGDTQ